MEDVATWQEWTDNVPNSMSVNVQVESQECGTAQPTSDNTQLTTLNKGGGVVERGGEVKQKPRCRNKRGKNKLPGESKSQKSVTAFFEKTAENIHAPMVGEAGTVSRSGGVCQDGVSMKMHAAQTDRQKVMRGVPDAGRGKGVKVETKEITLQRGGEGQSSEKLADFSSLLGVKGEGGCEVVRK